MQSLDELFSVLGDQRIGDVVTAHEHALQCAFFLQQQFPDDEELQLAGLVHDVASSLDPVPPGCHAKVGAQLVGPLLGERVALLVSGHVEAKRWLVSADPEYRALLSENSLYTLSRQGEELTALERAQFENSPCAEGWLRLRRADDRAKQPGLAVPPLSYWRLLAEKYARKQAMFMGVTS